MPGTQTKKKKAGRKILQLIFFVVAEKLTFFTEVVWRLSPAAVDGRRQRLELLGAALKEAVEVLAAGRVVDVVVVGVSRRRRQRLRGRREAAGPEINFLKLLHLGKNGCRWHLKKRVDDIFAVLNLLLGR